MVAEALSDLPDHSEWDPISNNTDQEEATELTSTPTESEPQLENETESSTRQEPAQSASGLFDDTEWEGFQDIGTLDEPAVPAPSQYLLNESEVPVEEFTATERLVAEHAVGVRTRMTVKYGRQHTIEQFQEGDVVTLKIPKEDRTAADNRRIPCIVVKVLHPDRHQFQTEYGILKTHYPVRELLQVPSDVASEMRTRIAQAGITKQITLHRAAALASTSDRVGVSCNL
ncbi:MAG: hypothetical protein M1816_005919 [Peltula sp. TS41687]|nr:MAG: hypothetical protein M1816_005919 [Peltula sp. TS41687]